MTHHHPDRSAHGASARPERVSPPAAPATTIRQRVARYWLRRRHLNRAERTAAHFLALVGGSLVLIGAGLSLDMDLTMAVLTTMAAFAHGLWDLIGLVFLLAMAVLTIEGAMGRVL